MRILVVVPRFVENFGDFYQFPIGLAYITAAVKKSGHKVYGLNLNHVFGSEMKLVEDEVRKLSIDACLTGGLSPDLPGIRKIFTGARNGNKDILNVAGGGVVSSDPMISLDLMDIDIGIIGEGEFSIQEVLNAHERALDLAEIPGIVHRNVKGEVSQTDNREPIMDFSQIAWPEYDLLGFNEDLHLQRPLDHQFIQTQPDSNPRAMYMISSRSCVFNCTFCFHPLGKRYRERSLDDFFNELKHYIDKYQINMVTILDQLFCLRKKRLLEFCERIKPLNIQWFVQLHVNTPDDDIFDAMYDAGCSFIGYGIESMNADVLRSMQKKSESAQIVSTLKRTYDKGLGTVGHLIFGDTAESLESANETMSWWAHNQKYRVFINPLQVYPGSPLYIEAFRDDLITDRLCFAEKLPKPGELNISNMNTTNLKEMLFQLNVHKITLLKLAPLKHFKKSQSQIEGRDTAFDIVWKCPRCKFTNNHKQCVLQPNSIHFIRVFCRECVSRWDVENKASSLPSLAVGLESGQQKSTNLASVDGGSNPRVEEAFPSFDDDLIGGWMKRTRAVPYIYEKQDEPRMEVRKAGSDLLESPFDPERHCRFANALRAVGAFGAARIHYQQAIDVCHYWDQSGDLERSFSSSKYRKLLEGLTSDPVYSKHSETYFVSYSNAPPPYRPSREAGGQCEEHESEFPIYDHTRSEKKVHIAK